MPLLIDSNNSSGHWAELVYDSVDTQFTSRHMWAYTIVRPPTESAPHRFDLVTSSFRGDRYVGSGSYTETEDRAIFDLNFCLNIEGSNSSYDVWYSGRLDVLCGSISGTWGSSSDRTTHFGVFVLKRTPSHILRFRPAPSVFVKNKSATLWQYALSAVLHLVRRRLWTWSYFRERRDHRIQYLALAFREGSLGRERSPEESVEYWRLRQLISHHDAPFYDMLRQRKERSLITRYCAVCL